MYYIATRNITLGQIRRTIHQNDIVWIDGTTLRINKNTYTLPNLPEIMTKGWFLIVEETITSQLPAVVTAAVPAVIEGTAISAKTSSLPFSSKEARAADGKRTTANTQHVWVTSFADDPVCSVCGVTQRDNVILPDYTFTSGNYIYTDVKGKTIVSPQPLSCPVFVGDAVSAAAITKDHVRTIRSRVDDHDDTISTLQNRIEELERTNMALMRHIMAQSTLDPAAVIDALAHVMTDGEMRSLLENKIQHLLTTDTTQDTVIDAMTLEPVLVHQTSDHDNQS